MRSHPYDPCPKLCNSGLSFLEVLVAVAIIALLSSAAILVNRDRLPVEQHLGEVRQVAGRISQFVSQARLTRSVFRFSCTAEGIMGTRHDAAISSTPVFNFAQAMGSLPIIESNLILESVTNPLKVTCPFGNSFVISPRGEVLGGAGRAGVVLQFESSFSPLRVGDNTAATTLVSRLVVSGEGGVTRIFVGDKAAGSLGEQP